MLPTFLVVGYNPLNPVFFSFLNSVFDGSVVLPAAVSLVVLRAGAEQQQHCIAQSCVLPSFLSGEFITAIVVNPPERKLAKGTSVHWRACRQQPRQTPNASVHAGAAATSREPCAGALRPSARRNHRARLPRRRKPLLSATVASAAHRTPIGSPAFKPGTATWPSVSAAMSRCCLDSH